MAARVSGELRDLGFVVEEDDAGAAIGGDAGNLLCRIAPPEGSDASVLLCAHLDTVDPGDTPIDPVLVNGGWENANDAILGADNKAAVAVLLAVARRARAQGLPCGLELLFTVAEEDALVGGQAFEAGRIHSPYGYVFDQASPIGEIVMASPTYYRLQADFHGREAHAGIRPQDGSSAVVAASRAVAAMPLGRLDEETTANVASVHGGPAQATNIVPARCRVMAEARSLDEVRAEAAVTALVDHCHDAANDPECACDVDIVLDRRFAGYQQRPSDPEIVVAEAALRACGYEPSRITTGGGSDANTLRAAGLACANLANGTERNHEPTERVSVVALEGMLDVAIALLDEVAR